MSNSQDLQSIEITIEQAQASVQRMECLKRLKNNPDFKKIILEEYLRDHAVRQVLRRANPAYQSEKLQKDLMDNITAIGQFDQYLHSVITLGESAAAALSAHEETREELLAEGIGDE